MILANSGAGGSAAAIAVVVTAVGGAIAAVGGAVSSRRSRSDAKEAERLASEHSKASLGLEERTVARAEFDSVVAGLRAWADTLSAELGAARVRIAALEKSNGDKDAEVAKWRRASDSCQEATAALRARLAELGDTA